MRRFTIYVAWLLLFVLAVTMVVTWTTNYWWFSSLGQGDTYLRMARWRIGGFLVGAALFALIFGQNVRLALAYLHAHTMDYVLLGSGVNRFGGPSFNSVRRASVVGIWIATFLAGAAAASRFKLWVALFSTIKTGQIDKISGRDTGFFLFTLPALEWIWWFFGFTLFLSLCFCAGLYLWGELIETGPRILRVSQRVATHLAYLSALLILWQGIRLGLQIVDAPVTIGWTRSEVFGPAEETFRTPTLFFFLLTSFPLAFLVARRAFGDFSPESKRIPIGIGASLWLGLSLILPTLAAPFGRSISSNGALRQKTAIFRHLESTRKAWQIDDITSRQIVAPQGEWVIAPTVSEATASKAVDSTVAGQNLWPPETLAQSLNSTELTDPASGLNIARVHTINQGEEVFYRAVAQNHSSNESQEGTLFEIVSSVGAPRIAARRKLSPLLLTENSRDTSRDIVQYPPPLPVKQVSPPNFRWSSDSDFSVSDYPLWHSLLLALRFLDSSLLASGQNLTWYVDPVERARTLFPFVNFSESEALPEQVGERLYWNVAGFSVSRNHPDSARLQSGSTWRGFNYIRQSTAVIMDGSTGASYAVQLNPEEPFSKLWREAFPEAFTPIDQLPVSSVTLESIKASVKPAAAYIAANTEILARYRPEKDDVENFENRSSLWRVWNPQQAQSGFCAFSPAQSGSSNGESLTAIPAFFKINPVNFATNPRLRWQQFRLPEPVELPKEVLSQSSNSVPNPNIPTLFSFKLSPSKSEDGLTRLTFIRSEAINFKEEKGWFLRITSSSKGETDASTLSDSENLSRTAQRWREWKAAVRAGDWKSVQEKERELDDILSNF